MYLPIKNGECFFAGVNIIYGICNNMFGRITQPLLCEVVITQANWARQPCFWRGWCSQLRSWPQQTEATSVPELRSLTSFRFKTNDTVSTDCSIQSFIISVNVRFSFHILPSRIKNTSSLGYFAARKSKRIHFWVIADFTPGPFSGAMPQIGCFFFGWWWRRPHASRESSASPRWILLYSRGGWTGYTHTYYLAKLKYFTNLDFPWNQGMFLP